MRNDRVIGQETNPDVLIHYVEKVIHGKLSACQAARLCLSPTAQARHFLEKARRILDSEKLQALNRRLDANRHLLTPEKEKQVVADYLNGASRHQIVQRHHMWDQSVRSILHKHGMEIGDTSQQLLLRFHGRIPTAGSGMSKEKLYVAFGMLGDHAERHQALKNGNYKLGIAAWQDYYFAEVWCNNFEVAYGLRPHKGQRF